MKLPNAATCAVEKEKLVSYLLNPAHPDNGGKAAFFLSLGFTLDNWEIFAAALVRLAQTTDLAQSMESLHGWKYVIDGRLDTPRGKSPVVRTIWIVDLGFEVPRLVTAYPQEE
jgi:hypothetical protein